jgi:hypothetical protein
MYLNIIIIIKNKMFKKVEVLLIVGCGVDNYKEAEITKKNPSLNYFKKICLPEKNELKLKKFRKVSEYSYKKSKICAYSFLRGIGFINSHELPRPGVIENSPYYGPILLVRIKNNKLKNLKKKNYMELYEFLQPVEELTDEERSTDGSDTAGSLKNFIVDG